MSNRFHNKFHRHNHHTNSTAGPLYPDSGYDPIASQESPFQGEFYSVDQITTTNNLSAQQNLYAQNGQFYGDVSIDNTLQIGGNTTMSSNALISGNLTVGVDATINRDLQVLGDLTIVGNLTALGNTSYLDTIVSVTSALSVVNTGTGPALKVTQTGAQPVAEFVDAEGGVVVISDTGNLGIGTYNPVEKLTVYGNITGTHEKVAFGQSTATGLYSFSQNLATASGSYSHAEGLSAIASQQASHAEGFLTVASQLASHAEGQNTTSSGVASHAEGQQTIASGSASHTEGLATSASNIASHAEGITTIASSSASHAEGLNTGAFGLASHTEGGFTTALGDYSHAAGYRAEGAQNYTYIWSDGNLGTNTANVSTTKTGQYMVSASGGMFIPGNVGIGTDNNSNALTVNGVVSATGQMYAYAGYSDQWNSVYSCVTSISGNWILDGGNSKSQNLSVGTNDNYDLLFKTSNYTRIAIASGGNVGIGTTSPNNALTVLGSVSSSQVLYALSSVVAETTIMQGVVKIADSSPTNSLLFGSGNTNYDTNLYRKAANILKTDDELIVEGKITAVNGLSSGSDLEIFNNKKLILGYSPAPTTNDGAEIWMDYPTTADAGELIISTRDNASEPIVFRQRQDSSAPGWYFEPLIIGSDNKVGIAALSGTRAFPMELTVYGSISSSVDGDSTKWNATPFEVLSAATAPTVYENGLSAVPFTNNIILLANKTYNVQLYAVTNSGNIELGTSCIVVSANNLFTGGGRCESNNQNLPVPYNNPVYVSNSSLITNPITGTSGGNSFPQLLNLDLFLTTGTANTTFLVGISSVSGVNCFSQYQAGSFWKGKIVS